MYKLKTWHIETAVVYSILIGVNLYVDADLIGWVGAVAVALSFGTTSISARMTEAQEKLAEKTVHCYKWFNFYYVGKEITWVAYFVMLKSWSALVGCFVFGAYPVWRKLYTQWRDNA
jgi:hypothetical protein